MLKILIVDDHTVVRKGLKLILTDEFVDVKIDEASNVEELMKLILHNNYSMILCDVSMPGRSGIEVLKQLHLEFPKLPVLILSMHPEEQYAIRAIKAGAMGYLTKDCASSELVKAIKCILGGKKYISSHVSELLANTISSESNRLPHELLSDREFEVLKLIAIGNSVSDIASILSLSVATISTYRSRLLEKMKIRSNAELILYAINNSLV